MCPIGEIALLSIEPDATKAEAYFERALDIARKQQAKSWELRAVMSMARLALLSVKVRTIVVAAAILGAKAGSTDVLRSPTQALRASAPKFAELNNGKIILDYIPNYSVDSTNPDSP